jgi:hypothetical protein
MKTRLHFGVALATLVTQLGCGRAGDDTVAVDGTGGDTSEFGLPRCAPRTGENPESRGEWTLSGAVKTADGAALVGVPVAISGDAMGSYQTNILGRYQVRLPKGNYDLQVGDAACSVTEGARQTIGQAPSEPVNFEGDGPACTTATTNHPTSTGAELIINRRAENHGDPVPEAYVYANAYIGWTEARSREFIDEIKADPLGPLCETTIAGYPALEYLPTYPPINDNEDDPPTLGARTFVLHPAGLIGFGSEHAINTPEDRVNFLLVSVRNLSKDDVDELAEGNWAL